MHEEITTLVLGASRGLGFAMAEGWAQRGARVVGTVRTPSAALSELAIRHGNMIEIEVADILDAGSIRDLRERLDGRRIDLLVVNAGIARGNEETPATIDEADYTAMMLTNALGPARAIEILHDLVPPNGVIAAMSSELGSIARNTALWELYSSSKAALNMLLKCFAGRHPQDTRALLAIAPGWIRTEMGGSAASYSIGETIPLVVEMIERSRGRPGLRFVDRFDRTLPW